MRLLGRIIFLLLTLSTSLLLSTAAPGSQRENARLSGILNGIEASRIPTGIFYNRAFPLSRIADHDGRKESRPASLKNWRQIYHEMSRASLTDPSWPALETFLEVTRRSTAEGTIPIALMNFRYNKIRQGALDDGSLVVEGGRLVVVGGDPFGEARLFAAAALKDYTHRGELVVFALDRDRYLSNDGAVPRLLEIDFADGAGFREVQYNGRYPVRYACTGRKMIRVKITFTDGTSLYGSFYFEVIRLQAPTPDDTLFIDATIPYNSEYGSGEAYVYLSDSHTTLTNPVVVVEGFDLDNNMNWDELYEFLNQENLIETIRTIGFDAVVLNFTDATDYIQKNSFVVVELIQQIKAAIGPQADFVLAGASMGGLATRYALAYMETNALDHAVRTFISFDAPHNGANIPLGVQYWVKFFSDLSADAGDMLVKLDRPASRQMLVYHHTDPPGSTGQSDPLRADLLADFAAVVQYPVNLRKVAVANGSGSQTNQGFAAGDQIIEYEYNSFLVDIVGNIWAVPDGAGQMIFDGLIDIILLPKETMSVTVSGTIPYDNAPGGFRSSMAQMDSTEAPYGDIVALHDNHCFVPTVSALALDVTDLFYDIAGDADILAHTPFDAVYYPVENQEHGTITPESAEWFLMEIRSGATSVGPDSYTVAGVVLYQNFPNPFNPTTMIRFVLPAATNVKLSVHDTQGRLIVALVDRQMSAGEKKISWDGRNARGDGVSSGVYFYRLQAGDRVYTKKMILLK